MLQLKKLRLEKDLTQAELGKMLKISPSTIGMYEQGRRTPDPGTLVKMANLFGVSVDLLLGRTELLPTNDNSPFAKEVRRIQEELKTIQAQLPSANKQTPPPEYYRDPEVARIAQEMHDNPGIKVLFDAGKGLSKESIEEVRRFIEYQKAKELGDFD